MKNRINDVNILIKIKLKKITKEKTEKYTFFNGKIFLEIFGKSMEIGGIDTIKTHTKEALISRVKDEIMWKLKSGVNVSD